MPVLNSIVPKFLEAINFIIPFNPPYGAIPGSEVAYDMTTSMIMFGISYNFSK